jgi:hypothetical protein
MSIIPLAAMAGYTEDKFGELPLFWRCLIFR